MFNRKSEGKQQLGIAVVVRNTRLPGVLQEIANITDYDAAIIMARAKGGQYAYIPVSAPNGHWLVEAVGRARADLICKHFSTGAGGIHLDIPFGPESSKARLKNQIEQILKADHSLSSTAKTLGICKRTVVRHKARLKKEGKL